MVAIDYQAVLQTESEGLSDIAGLSSGTGIADAARHIDLGHRSLVGQTTCHHNQILDGGVSSKLINTWAEHLASDGECAILAQILLGGDKQYILVLQRHIGYSAIQDALEINRYCLQRAVGQQAVQYYTSGRSILGNTLGSLNQALNGSNMTAQLELSRTEHGTLNLNHILVTVNHAINGNGIAIGHLEVRHIELVNIIYGIALATLAHQANRLFVGIACKATGIF